MLTDDAPRRLVELDPGRVGDRLPAARRARRSRVSAPTVPADTWASSSGSIDAVDREFVRGDRELLERACRDGSIGLGAREPARPGSATRARAAVSTDPTTNLLGRTRAQTIRRITPGCHVRSARGPLVDDHHVLDRAALDRTDANRRSRRRSGPGCPRHPGRAGSPRRGGRWRSRSPGSAGTSCGAPCGRSSSPVDRIEVEQAEPADRRVVARRRARPRATSRSRPSGRRTRRTARRRRPPPACPSVSTPFASVKPRRTSEPLAGDRGLAVLPDASRCRPRSRPSARPGRRRGARRSPSMADSSPLAGSMKNDSAACRRRRRRLPISRSPAHEAKTLAWSLVAACGELVTDAPDVDVRACPSRPTGAR